MAFVNPTEAHGLHRVPTVGFAGKGRSTQPTLEPVQLAGLLDPVAQSGFGIDSLEMEARAHVMSFISYQAKLFNGSPIAIRLLPDGRSVCPVCGTITTGEPPYNRGEFDSSGKLKNDPPKDKLWATGSMDICPQCHTQYGYSDFLDDFPGMTQERVWATLRRDWLNRINWTPAALAQLAENLDIDIVQLQKERTAT